MHVTQHQTLLILNAEIKKLRDRETALVDENEELVDLLGAQYLVIDRLQRND